LCPWLRWGATSPPPLPTAPGCCASGGRGPWLRAVAATTLEVLCLGWPGPLAARRSCSPRVVVGPCRRCRPACTPGGLGGRGPWSRCYSHGVGLQRKAPSSWRLVVGRQSLAWGVGLLSLGCCLRYRSFWSQPGRGAGGLSYVVAAFVGLWLWDRNGVEAKVYDDDVLGCRSPSRRRHYFPYSLLSGGRPG
jgi:hypothetical protein